MRDILDRAFGSERTTMKKHRHNNSKTYASGKQRSSGTSSTSSGSTISSFGFPLPGSGGVPPLPGCGGPPGYGGLPEYGCPPDYGYPPGYGGAPGYGGTSGYGGPLQPPQSGYGFLNPGFPSPQSSYGCYPGDQKPRKEKSSSKGKSSSSKRSGSSSSSSSSSKWSGHSSKSKKQEPMYYPMSSIPGSPMSASSSSSKTSLSSSSKRSKSSASSHPFGVCSSKKSSSYNPGALMPMDVQGRVNRKCPLCLSGNHIRKSKCMKCGCSLPKGPRNSRK